MDADLCLDERIDVPAASSTVKGPESLPSDHLGDRCGAVPLCLPDQTTVADTDLGVVSDVPSSANKKEAVVGPNPTPSRWKPCIPERKSDNVMSIRCTFPAGLDVKVHASSVLNAAKPGKAEVVMRQCSTEKNGTCDEWTLNKQTKHASTAGDVAYNGDTAPFTPKWENVDFTVEVSDETGFSISSSCFTVSKIEQVKKPVPKKQRICLKGERDQG